MAKVWAINDGEKVDRADLKNPNRDKNSAWDGTTNPGNGWCNINNSATIASWEQTWKK